MQALTLRMRTADLRANLSEVADVVDFVVQKDRHLRFLGEKVTKLAELIEACQKRLERATTATEKIGEGQMPQAAEVGLDAHIAAAKEHLAEGTAELEQLRHEVSDLSSRPMQFSERSDVSGTLKRRIAQVAANLLELLNQVDAYLDEASNAADPEGAEADASLHLAWKTMVEDVEPKLPSLFGEYVEFLGGLALRDSGLDAGICRLVDQLMADYDKAMEAKWKSLSIPGFEENISVDAARIIRLGFSEWSIPREGVERPALWAIPLTVHQFGQLLVTHPDHDTYMSKDDFPAWVKDDYATLLADAFATFSMGPAYACAEILLRLNPLTVGRTDGPAAVGQSQARAGVILAMLQHLQGDDPGDYGALTNKLEREWRSAVRQAHLRDGATGPAAAVTALPDADAITILADQLIPDLATFFRKGSSWSVEYNAEKYAEVADWYEPMTRGAPGEIDISTMSGDQFDFLRHLLNAAWRARLELPTATEAIHETVWTLWESLAAAEAGGPTVRTGGLASIPEIGAGEARKTGGRG